MSMDARMARAFGLDGDGWQRHANPWSVYTRIPIPPLLAAAIRSRTRLGRRSLVPVGVVCAWTFIARGLVVRDGWMVLFGLAVQMAGKIWFIDRMALLYDDVAPAGPASDAPGAGADPPVS